MIIEVGVLTDIDRDSYLAFEQLIHRIYPEARLLRVWPMTGGISAQVTAVEIRFHDGRLQSMIVRQHGSNDLRSNPNIAVDEFKLLKTLHHAGLPVPKPHYVDSSGEIFPTPCIMVDYIEGATDFTPQRPIDYANQMAEQLMRIHGVETSVLGFLPRKEDHVARWISKQPLHHERSLNMSQMHATLRSSWLLPRQNKVVLLHGDYWPGNVLWKDGQLVGIIDWEDAAFGDPLSDLANARLELLWTCGYDVMQRFTEHYQSLTNCDLASLPLWDLYTAARSIETIAGWGLDEVKERRMREQATEFAAHATNHLERL